MARQKTGPVTATEHEIDFINRLGEFSEWEISRKELLLRYQIAIDGRVEWGKIDKDQVVQHLEKTLEGLC